MPETPGASAGAGRNGVNKGEETALAVIQEIEYLLDSVYCPYEDNFLRAPVSLAFAELLEGDLFFPCSVVLFVGSEEVVDGVK